MSRLENERLIRYSRRGDLRNVFSICIVRANPYSDIYHLYLCSLAGICPVGCLID